MYIIKLQDARINTQSKKKMETDNHSIICLKFT